MPTLTWYIARLYATNIVLLAVVFVLFTVTIDAFLNLRLFVRAGLLLGSGADSAEDVSGWLRAVWTAWAVWELWWPRMLQLFNALSGLLLIGGLGFTASQLVKQREIVAMLASGISLFRVSRSFFLVGAVVLAAQLVNQEVVIPSIADRLGRSVQDIGRGEVSSIAVTLAEDERGSVWHAVSFDPEAGVLGGVNIWLRDPESGVLGHLRASEARWEGEGSGRWSLTDGWYLAMDGAGGGAGDGRGTPIEAYETVLDPTRLRVKWMEGFGAHLSWSEIGEIVSVGGLEPAATARLERARWGRVGVVLSNGLVLVAAMPLFLLRMPRGLLGATLRAAPVAGLGLVAAAAAPNVAYPGVPPAMGAMVPALVLLPIAWGMYGGMRS
ncbi:MAG: LptF/LptG family permease [Phycisphaerales bacterium]